MSTTKYIAKDKRIVGNSYYWNVSLQDLLKRIQSDGRKINDFDFYIETDVGEMGLNLSDTLTQGYDSCKELQNRLYDVCVEKANLERRIEEAIKILEGGSNE